MKRSLVALTMLVAACEQRVDEAVTLVYAPQVGHAYAYEVSIERGPEVALTRHIESKTAEGFVEQHRMVKRGEENHIVCRVSPRYTSDDDRFIDLDFPTESVATGDTWTGHIPFGYMNQFTMARPEIEVVHWLESVPIKDGRRVAEILTRPIEPVGTFEIPARFGQIGVRCDLDGIVREVVEGFGAEGRIRARDRVVAITGKRVASALERNMVVQQEIESLTANSQVILSVEREGVEIDVPIERTEVAVGDLELGYTSFGWYVRSVFDVDRGVLLSHRARTDFTVTYPVREILPKIVDRLSGADGLEQLAERETFTRKVPFAWEMTLVDDRVATTDRADSVDDG